MGIVRKNIVLPQKLWQDKVDIASAKEELTKREFLIKALQYYLEKVKYTPELKTVAPQIPLTEENKKTANIDLPSELWREVNIQSAIEQIDKRDLVAKALEIYLSKLEEGNVY